MEIMTDPMAPVPGFCNKICKVPPDSSLMEEARVSGHQGCSVINRCEIRHFALGLVENEK